MMTIFRHSPLSRVAAWALALALTGLVVVHAQNYIAAGAAGTLTTSNPFTGTQTWNASGVSFVGMTLGFTETASAAGSQYFVINGGSAGTTQEMALNKGGALALGATSNQLLMGVTNVDTISFTAPAASRTITFGDPLGNDSVTYLAATQTLTNKTLTAPTVTTPAISGAALSSGNFIGVPAVQSSGSLGGTPVTLTAAQCGQAFALDAATGVIYILPSTFPTAGCTYDFYVTVSVTSNAHEIESGNAAHFFLGAPMLAAAAATSFVGVCNGTTHIAYKTNGTTTGGLIGTHIRVTVLSTTQAWLDGINAGSGTLATPCSTSN